MRVLLDTNVLSELLRKRPEPSVVQRAREVPSGSAFTSTVCVMELRYGALRRGGEAGRRLWSRIERELLPTVTVLPIDDPEGVHAAELMAALTLGAHPWVSRTF
jgi:predicted nucleic acid-binding protein